MLFLYLRTLVNAFLLLLSWIPSVWLTLPHPQHPHRSAHDPNAYRSTRLTDSEAEVIQQIKVLGLNPLWYSAQYQARLEGKSALVMPTMAPQAQGQGSASIEEYILNGQLVFSPNYQGIVSTPASGWYHFQSKARLRKASKSTSLAQQIPVGSDRPVFVASGAVVIQESPSTARYQEYNVHVFNGASGQYDWYEVDSLSIAPANASGVVDPAPARWRFNTQAVSGGFRITTKVEHVQASTAKRFAYHIHGLDRRPDSITANGKNIVYIYLPETQSVIFKLSAGEHHLLVYYP